MPNKGPVADSTPKPVEVSSMAGQLDALTAAGRLLVVVLGAIPTLQLIIGTKGLMGLIEFFQGDDGKKVAGAVATLAALLYALYKSHKRGAQIATVAADRRVPDAVAKLK